MMRSVYRAHDAVASRRWEGGRPVTIFDLMFLVTVVLVLAALVGALYALARGRGQAAWRSLVRLGAGLGLYAVVLIAVSLTSTPRILGPHQPQCFDEWCVRVTQVVQGQTIGWGRRQITAQGRFYRVTLQVSNAGQRTSQRAVDAQVFLVDPTGRRYDPASNAQRTLDASGAGGQALATVLAPSASVTRTVVFDVPRPVHPSGLVVVHGLFPTLLIIAHPRSLLHQPTILTFPTS